MSRFHPGAMERQLAAQLHAADARKLLRSKMPDLLDVLTPAQIAQVQKALDFPVVEPVLRAKYVAAARKEIAREHAHGIFRDPARSPVHYSQQMLNIGSELHFIEGEAGGTTVPIPYQKVLAPGALAPRSGLSEENDILGQIRQKLDKERVVSLHVAPIGPDQAPFHYHVWLTLGQGRWSTLRTRSGRLTRDDLLEYWWRPIRNEARLYDAEHRRIFTRKSVKPGNSGIWFGIGIQGGSTFGLGIGGTVAVMYSLDHYADRFFLYIREIRLGLDAGASGGAALVIATGGKTPGAFDGLKTGGVNFKASVGENWAAFATGMKELGLAAQVAKAGDSLGKSKLNVKQWEKIATIIQDMYKGAGAALSKRAVTVLSIPGAGGGIEIGVYYGWDRCYTM